MAPSFVDSSVRGGQGLSDKRQRSKPPGVNESKASSFNAAATSSASSDPRSGHIEQPQLDRRKHAQAPLGSSSDTASSSAAVKPGATEGAEQTQAGKAGRKRANRSMQSAATNGMHGGDAGSVNAAVAAIAGAVAPPAAIVNGPQAAARHTAHAPPAAASADTAVDQAQAAAGGRRRTKPARRQAAHNEPQQRLAAESGPLNNLTGRHDADQHRQQAASSTRQPDRQPRALAATGTAPHLAPIGASGSASGGSSTEPGTLVGPSGRMNPGAVAFAPGAFRHEAHDAAQQPADPRNHPSSVVDNKNSSIDRKGRGKGPKLRRQVSQEPAAQRGPVHRQPAEQAAGSKLRQPEGPGPVPTDSASGAGPSTCSGALAPRSAVPRAGRGAAAAAAEALQPLAAPGKRARQRQAKAAVSSKNNAYGASASAAPNGGLPVPVGLASDGPAFQCCVCCEDATAVSVGQCDHHHMCAHCCLRLRLCYKDLRCPLCKQTNSEVVLMSQPAEGVVPKFAELQQQPALLWSQPKWARGVYVHEPAGSRQLSTHLTQITSCSCSVCDSDGSSPFPSNRALQSHLKAQHGRSICTLCLAAGRKFIRDYEVMNRKELAAHSLEHPE